MELKENAGPSDNVAPIPMNLGEKISYLRKKESLSQETLGQMLYVTRQAISRWEHGESEPNKDNLMKMSELFIVPIEWLLNNDKGIEDLSIKPEKDKETDEGKIPENDPEDSTAKQIAELFSWNNVTKAIKEKPVLSILFLGLALFPGLFYPLLLLVTLPLMIISLVTDQYGVYIKLVAVIIAFLLFLAVLMELDVLGLFRRTEIREIETNEPIEWPNNEDEP